MPAIGALAQVKQKAVAMGKSAFSTAPLEKAKLYRVRPPMQMGDPIPVQFNPSEYQISRSVTMSRKQSIGCDPDITKLQAVSGNFATLSLTLSFDTISDLTDEHSLSAFTKGMLINSKKSSPTEVCQEIATLLRYDEKERSPVYIRFAWGKFDFTGYVVNSSVSYTMFAQDGTPLRAKLSLSLSGEETSILLKSMQQALSASSADRTKERVSVADEPLWQTSSREYGDPAKWKDIAKENNILNPRKVSNAAVLRLPSTK